MSDKKFKLPEISLPKPDKETLKKAAVSGAVLAAVAVSCALLLSGTNLLLSSFSGEVSSTTLADTDNNTAMPSSGQEVAVN